MDVSRWPLTEIASAPASQRPLTTTCRSLEKTVPSSFCASVRGLPSALVPSLPGALSSTTVMPGPVTRLGARRQGEGGEAGLERGLVLPEGLGLELVHLGLHGPQLGPLLLDRRAGGSRSG